MLIIHDAYLLLSFLFQFITMANITENTTSYHCIDVQSTSHAIGYAIVNTLVVFSNTIGLLLLFKVKLTRQTNTNIVPYANFRLLVLLSATDLAVGIAGVIFALLNRFSFSQSANSSFVLSSTMLVFLAGISLSAVYMLTLNHLISTVFEVWYQTSMTKTKFKILTVMVCVVITTLHLVCVVLLVLAKSTQKSISAIPPVIVMVSRFIIQFLYYFYFLFCVGTYVAILVKISASRRSVGNMSGDAGMLQSIWKTLNTQGYTKPFLIAITYLLFVAIPYVVHMNLSCSTTAIRVWGTTVGLNNISDVLIYVFSDHKIREYLKELFRKTKSKNSVDQTSNNVLSRI